MARFRYSVLKNDVAESADTAKATKTIDLPEKGILSEIILLIRGARTYTSEPSLPFYHMLTDVNVMVDGSTVIKSLDGRQAKALEWYNNGPFGLGDGYGGGGNSNKSYYPTHLYFGKKANDTKNGLDLGAYANPKLEFSFDASLTGLDGVTYDATTSPTFTYNIMAKLIDGHPPGFTNRYCQSREINSYNPAASGESNTEIPRGYDLKGIMMGTRYTSKAWYAGLNHVKLDFDNGTWMPIDMDYENLVVAMREWFPREVQWGGAINVANADPFDSRMLQIDSLSCGGVGNQALTISRDGWEFPIYACGVQTAAGAAETNRYATYVDVRGFGPMQTIYIPMEPLLDGEVDVLNTKPFGRIDCKITTASYSASAITHVVAEYMKPNGA